jgi:agmatine deiminase
MIPDWKTNCVFFSRLLPSRYPAMWNRLAKILHDHRVPVRLLDATRDIWARDYCPIQAARRRFAKFRYTPDYLRGRYRHLMTGNEICGHMQGLGKIQFTEIILDGGNVVSASKMAIVTEKVLQENPSRGPKELQLKLARLLNVDQCLFIPVEPGDPIGHSDGTVRFLSDNLLVFNDYTRVDPAYGRWLRRALPRHRLEMEPLPHFREDNAVDGIPSAVGNYVNFLRVGDLIIVPAYGHKNDDRACRTIERLCPQATVTPLECSALAREGGVLNCVAWTARTSEATSLQERVPHGQP